MDKEKVLRLAAGLVIVGALKGPGLPDRSFSPPIAEPGKAKPTVELNPTVVQPNLGIETPFAENEDGVTIYTGSNPPVEPNPTVGPQPTRDRHQEENGDGATLPTGGQVRLTPSARVGILTPVSR